MYTKVIVGMAVGFALIQTQVVKAIDPPTVAWWRMQDMQNGVIPDATGNGHDLTINGTPTFQGNIVIFNDDGTLETPDSDALDLLGDWSVSFWAREDSNDHSPNSNPSNGWVEKIRSYGDAEGGWAIASDTGRLRTAIYRGLSNNCSHDTDGPLPQGVWTRITTTFDATTMTVSTYWNDSLKFSSNIPTNPVSACSVMPNIRPLVLGGYLEIDGLTMVPYCKGAMADVRIYDRVLSELEVAELVAETIGDVSPGMVPTVAWWRMQDMQNGVIPDASGNGHDLTINGTPTFQGNIVIFNDDGTLETPDSDALDLLGDWSVSYWVREDSNDHSPYTNPSNGWMSKIVAYADTGGGWFLNSSNDNAVNATIYGSPNCNHRTTNPLVIGRWYRLTTTFDSVANTIRIYLDNTLEYEVGPLCSHSMGNNNTPVLLGGNIELNMVRRPYCKGAMADVRIYDRVLSELEIGQLVADTTCDDFEDNVTDPSLWVWGGLNRATTGGQGGSWQWSHEEVIDPADGYLSMRVWGPTSGNTFGAEAWVRTLYDYNDGLNHLINFTWNAEVQDTHYNHYHIQVTDGYISPNGSIHWSDGSEEVIPGTADLLWRVVNGQEFPFASYPTGLPMSTWSITIDPSGLAVLYDGPDATGSIIRSEPLNLSVSWYVRFMVLDATSAGFPAGDIKLNLYDFCTNFCGNGVIDAGEACDDGSNSSGDGCSSACLIEDGYGCSGEPSVCFPDCNGNGIDDIDDIDNCMGSSDCSDCNANDVPDECEGECACDADCDDGVRCTIDTCVGNVCMYTNRPAGSRCGDDDLFCTDDRCDANGVCLTFSPCTTPPNLTCCETTRSCIDNTFLYCPVAK